MIGARDARKLSENGNARIAAKYEKIIKEAAENGKHSVSVKHWIPGRVQSFLRELGYTVEAYECPDRTDISW